MTDALIASTLIEFVIPGRPQQQGSKIKNRYGAIYDDNKALGSWRVDGITAAQHAYHGPKIMTPIAVIASFYFARPASHYGTGRNAGRLKPGAPAFYASAPDTDKLQRALGDVLVQAGLIGDDRLIVQWAAAKRWTADAPCTQVRVIPAEG